jgi:hypothetical protein
MHSCATLSFVSRVAFDGLDGVGKGSRLAC